MELLLTIGAVVLVIAALWIAKEFIAKAEERPEKRDTIHKEFQRLSKMATHVRI